MKKYIEEMIKEAYKSFKIKDIPVGAVIVYKEKIIARAHNTRIKSHNPMDHAEIIAIRKASKKIKDWRLNGCDLYVTLKPCDMCESVIRESRIDNVYYLIEKVKDKKTYSKTNFQKLDEKQFEMEIKEYQEKISGFFKQNCNR